MHLTYVTYPRQAKPFAPTLISTCPLLLVLKAPQTDISAGGKSYALFAQLYHGHLQHHHNSSFLHPS